MKRSRKSQQFLNRLQKIWTQKQRQCFNKLKQIGKNYNISNILCSQNLTDSNQAIQQDISTQQLGFERKDSKQRSNKELSILPNVGKKTQNNNPLVGSITNERLNYHSLMSVHEDLLTSCINKSGLDNQFKQFNQQSLSLLPSKHQSSTSHQIKNLYKSLFILQQQNYSYQQKIKNLQKNMQQALSRQIKENRKKTQSLQMVAQQMAEKNELIIQLQQKITMLQERYEYETNGVLQDELTQNRKQIQKLEKVNIKLDNQLRKVKDKLIECQATSSELNKNNSSLKEQNLKLKESLFELQIQIASYKSKQANFKASCKKIYKILSELNLQRKQGSYFAQLKESEKPSLQEFYRLELVFIYLYNIEDESYTFKQHLHLFDQEQIQVLNQIKHKFIDLKVQLQTKDQLMQTINYNNHQEKNPFNIRKKSNSNSNNYFQGQRDLSNFESHLNYNENIPKEHQEIYCHHQNLVDGSIFDVLIDNRNNASTFCKNSNNNRNSFSQRVNQRMQRVEPQKNLTMKLLQMQIDKNKQIQKISELKQKNMYIRNIILNLMKSLELKQNLLKTQTSGILDLIFDVFEYSEEQKEIVFAPVQIVKQKRFFGFI